MTTQTTPYSYQQMIFGPAQGHGVKATFQCPNCGFFGDEENVKKHTCWEMQQFQKNQ